MKQTRPKRTRLRKGGKGSGRPQLSADAIRAVEAASGYVFKNKSLLTEAMTHPSALNAQDAVKHSNQRLEFLGDRVLNLVIAHRLYVRRHDEREGHLAPRLNRLVRKEACADAMRHIKIGPYILMSSGEVSSGGRERDSTLGDIGESLIAAIYLDSGLTAARKFIEKAWAPQFTTVPGRIKDPKTRLQEWAQAHDYPLPDYDVIERTGPDHAPHFVIRVNIPPAGEATGEGRSKSIAERAAAMQFLERFAQETSDK